MKELEGKVIIITGGSSGIGKSLAKVLGAKGATIVFSGRNMETLLLAEKELTNEGIKALGVVADVSSEIDAHLLVQRTLKDFGRIDILINNAGISMRALFQELDTKVIEQVMNINFMGMVYVTKAALPYLLESKGSIVGISSIAGYRGLPGRTGYSASKFAMQGFLEALRTELMPQGVHVLVACPGFTGTNIRQTALAADGKPQAESPLDEQKIMSSDEVARHIALAIQKRKRDLVLTSQGKLTVWLNKLFPQWMDGKVFDHFAKEKDSPLQKFIRS